MLSLLTNSLKVTMNQSAISHDDLSGHHHMTWARCIGHHEGAKGASCQELARRSKPLCDQGVPGVEPS